MKIRMMLEKVDMQKFKKCPKLFHFLYQESVVEVIVLSPLWLLMFLKPHSGYCIYYSIQLS